LEKLISKDANVVVTLFGKEYSPEMIVEMGLALAGSREMQVVHITELPEQTSLDALNDEDNTIRSIERRIVAMAQDKSVEFRFDAVSTHQLVDAVHTISDLTHCKWMVMGWEGRASSGLLVRNPIGLLTTHLNSHFALFKDNGVRYIRKILVCLRPGREDALFLKVADRIARYHGAEFTFFRVIRENTSEDDQQELREVSIKLLGELESNNRVEIKQSNHPVKTILEAAASYDLLITGTPLENNILKALIGTGRDKFAEAATCSVLRLTLKTDDRYAAK